MTAPDWAAKARERWPGCEPNTHAGANGKPTLEVTLQVSEYRFFRWADQQPDGRWVAWTTLTDNVRPAVLDPIAAIEAAIRAEHAEARATLKRLKVWGVG